MSSSSSLSSRALGMFSVYLVFIGIFAPNELRYLGPPSFLEYKLVSCLVVLPSSIYSSHSLSLISSLTLPILSFAFVPYCSFVSCLAYRVRSFSFIFLPLPLFPSFSSSLTLSFHDLLLPRFSYSCVCGSPPSPSDGRAFGFPTMRQEQFVYY